MPINAEPKELVELEEPFVHDSLAQSLPKYTPAKDAADRLSPFDDFERAAELSERDPFPEKLTALKMRRKTAADQICVAVARAESAAKLSTSNPPHENSAPIEARAANGVAKLRIAIAEYENTDWTGLLEEEPLTPLERTISRAFQSQSPKDAQRRKTLHIKHPEMVTADTDCDPFEDSREKRTYSSDSWSGDDIFFASKTDFERPLQPQRESVEDTGIEQEVTYPGLQNCRPAPRSSRFYAPLAANAALSMPFESGQSGIPHDLSNGRSRREWN